MISKETTFSQPTKEVWFDLFRSLLIALRIRQLPSPKGNWLAIKG